MATIAFSPPKHWEDWVGTVLGLWLLVSPWVLEYGEITASQNAVLVGFCSSRSSLWCCPWPFAPGRNGSASFSEHGF